jgi:hypothetical protein
MGEKLASGSESTMYEVLAMGDPLSYWVAAPSEMIASFAPTPPIRAKRALFETTVFSKF